MPIEKKKSGKYRKVESRGNKITHSPSTHWPWLLTFGMFIIFRACYCYGDQIILHR